MQWKNIAWHVLGLCNIRLSKSQPNNRNYDWDVVEIINWAAMLLSMPQNRDHIWDCGDEYDINVEA